MGEKWPIHWRKAANAICAKPDKSMIPNQLYKLMTVHCVAQNHCIILAKWLHELGELLYFHDNEDLKNVVILKPQWVTEHISLVLTSKQVIDKQGILTDAHRDTLWSDLDHEIHEHFSNLMEQFDLSYRALEDRHTRFVVECLPSDPPDYQTTWDKMSGAKEIRMTYELNTLPPGIPTWFIARAHRFTTNTHWRYGALFADTSEHRNFGLIRVFIEERQLELVVRGSFPYEFFTQLRLDLEFTLQRFPGLKITRKIPCVGHNGQPCDYEFDYAEIEAAMLQSVTDIQCRKIFQNVSVYELVFGVGWQSKRADNGATHAKHNGKPHQHPICPPLFTLKQHKPSWWQKPFILNIIELHLCCESNQHPTEKEGCYSIPEFRKWVTALPILILIFNMWASSGISTLTPNTPLKSQLAFIKKLMQEFPDETIVNRVEGPTLRSFHKLLLA
jgi:hypothetical protein